MQLQHQVVKVNQNYHSQNQKILKYTKLIAQMKIVITINVGNFLMAILLILSYDLNNVEDS